MSQPKIGIQNKSIADKLKRTTSMMEVIAEPGANPKPEMAPYILALNLSKGELGQAASDADAADKKAESMHTLQNEKEEKFDLDFAAYVRQAGLSAKGDAAQLEAWDIDVRSLPEHHTTIA